MRVTHRHILLTATVAALAALLLWPRPGSEAPAPDPPERAQRGTPALPPPSPKTNSAPADDGPIHIELKHMVVRGGGYSCSHVGIPVRPYAPSHVLDEGPVLDQLGSRVLSASRRLHVPSGVQRRLDDWGWTPAWIGSGLARTSPWLALTALDVDNAWYPQRQKIDREADLVTALQLADTLVGDDEVGLRARLTRADILQGLAITKGFTSPEGEALREQAWGASLHVLHATDDPVLLSHAIEHLAGVRHRTTAHDDARMVEVIERLGPPLGSHLALCRAAEAFLRKDADAVLFWWRLYEPQLAYCEGIPAEDRFVEGCDCADDVGSAYPAMFEYLGWQEPTTLRARVAVASGRCYDEGHRAQAPDVDPDSDLGRCIQDELGPDVVLGRDVTLSYAQLPDATR